MDLDKLLEDLDKAESLFDQLIKMAKPIIQFPQIATKAPTKVPVLSEEHARTRLKLMGAPEDMDIGGVFGQKGSLSEERKAGLGGRANVALKQTGFISGKLDPKETRATEGHEQQHAMWRDLAARYHPRVTTALINKLADVIHPDMMANPASKTIAKLAFGLTDHPTIGKEEFFSYMHNYLNEPKFRNLVNDAAFEGFSGEHRLDMEREAYRHIDGIRKKAQAFANRVDEKMLESLGPEVFPQTRQAPTGIVKSEDLDKMAIADNKPPRKSNYSRFIPKHLQKQYGIWLREEDDPDFDTAIVARIYTKGGKGKFIGTFVGNVKGDGVTTHQFLSEDHRNKGLGSAGLEAVLTHAFHKCGVKRVSENTHTYAAGRVHASLSRKHGMGYSPEPLGPESSYHGGYVIKSEDNYLYHGTLVEHLPSILQHGLMPQPSISKHGLVQPKYIWVSKNHEKAANWAHLRSIYYVGKEYRTKPNVLLRFKSFVEPQEDPNLPENSESGVIEHTVSPKDIEVAIGNPFEENLTWQPLHDYVKMSKSELIPASNDAIVHDIHKAPQEHLNPEFYRVTPAVKQAYQNMGRGHLVENAQYISDPSPSIASSVTPAFDNDVDLNSYVKNTYDPYIQKTVGPSMMPNRAIFLAPIPAKSMRHGNATPYVSIEHLHGVSVTGDKRGRVPFYFAMGKMANAAGHAHPLFAPAIAEYNHRSDKDHHNIRIIDGNGRMVSARTAGVNHMMAYVGVKPEDVHSFLRMIHKAAPSEDMVVRSISGNPSIPSEFPVHEIPSILGKVHKSEDLMDTLNRVEKMFDSLKD